MHREWQISQKQKKLLDALFERIEEKVENVLDIGSGRTSIFYLADRFKDIVIEGIIYPGDNRKIDPIKECVKNENYRLIESDIRDFEANKTYDVVLAHQFLGEAEKFGGNKFKEILEGLFSIRTKYLIITDILTDPDIDYRLFLKTIVQNSEILKMSYAVSESGNECLGFLIKK